MLRNRIEISMILTSILASFWEPFILEIHQKTIQKSMRFSTPSKNDFLAPFGRPVVPKSRRIEFFGPFLAPPWILREPKNHPKSIFNIKNLQKKVLGGRPRVVQRQSCFQDRFLVDFGWIFDGFGWIWMDFGIISKGFWPRFCSSICRMPTPPGTKRNNGKRLEHTDNFRNMQKSYATKNA